MIRISRSEVQQFTACGISTEKKKFVMNELVAESSNNYKY